jgi:hypothetical protein
MRKTRQKYFLVFEEGDSNLMYEAHSDSYYSVPADKRFANDASTIWPYLALPISLALLRMIDRQTVQMLSAFPHSSALIIAVSVVLGIFLGLLFAKRMCAPAYASITVDKRLDTLLINSQFVRKARKRFCRQLVGLGATSLLPLGAFLICWHFGAEHLSAYLLFSGCLAIFIIVIRVVSPLSKSKYLRKLSLRIKPDCRRT